METLQTEQKTSPMMLQWHACKKAAGSAILFFRMGDFYEAFYEDATLLAKELELTLTRRQDIPMSGVPHHTCEAYIDKLVAKGYRVAVAEQTEDPKTTKGLVKREIVRVVTPGTLINSSLLTDKTNNYFASVTRVGSLFGLATLDLSTGDFRVIEFEHEQELLNEIHRLHPAEFLTSQKFQEKHAHLFNDVRVSYDFLLNTQEDWHFEHQAAHDFLLNHFGVHSLDGFGLRGMVAGINAAGALLNYFQNSLSLPINHIKEIQPYSLSQYMTMDRSTLRNLELTESLQDGSRRNTLLGLLDKTKTAMGGRLLRHWIKQPLLSVEEIARRQDAIQTFCHAPWAIEQLDQLLDGVRDLERLMMKMSSGYASPRDMIALKTSLQPIEPIKHLLQSISSSSTLLHENEQRLDPLPNVVSLIGNAIVEDPPVRLSDGRVFQDGYHRELDELRTISHDSKSWIANYQTQLREQTGIKTIKVGFNRMFGYYIEVSKGQADRMPDIFQRRQTLANAERYITPELKNYESKVLTAEDRIAAIESELFTALRIEVAKYASQVRQNAQALAQIDSLRSLGEIAKRHAYVRPVVDNSATLIVHEGRHPVIEASNASEKFIPNDTLLDDQANRLLIITGPNMAGKSTYIRQVALITIMAQIGAFIPAASAHIGVVDKVFTRIGASDDLSRGQSTFMVEMTETANILNNATSRSLVILDEIGRGTSTYDGISIAWAVAEHLLLTEGRMAKTLFATHYWELTKLESLIPGAVNYNVAVHESPEKIIFLRKIVKGGTDKSYGIHVGRLAGLPSGVISRAKEILIHLEENANRKSAFEPTRPKRQPGKVKPISNEIQLTLFGPN
jgi:DNA mismatch repair protein MutS